VSASPRSSRSTSIWSTKASSTSATPATARRRHALAALHYLGALFRKPTVARHRMVYQALGELMQDPIHALAISARSPEETKGKQ
jgi:hypothetical protein